MYPYYIKIQRWVARLARQGQSRSTTDLLRLHHYIWLVLVTIPTSALFIVSNLVSANYQMAAVVSMLFCSMAGSLKYIPRVLRIERIYHINNLVFITMLLLVLMFGNFIDGHILWTYTYPLLSIFLFGTRIGTLWSIILLACVFTLMHIGTEYSLGYSTRYLMTFVLIMVITSRLEYERQSYIRRTQRQRAALEKEREALKKEVHRRVELEQQLIKQANVDGLTGLYNRRCFWNEAKESIAVAKRYNIPLTFALIDIDDFKLLNDKYGHLAGDTVLADFAQLCRRHLRSTDIYGRVGGEEFAVLLLHTELEEAQLVMERFREIVSLHSCEVDRQSLQITISVGLCCLDAQQMDLEQAYNSADLALYQAKAYGRNQVVQHQLSQE
jgi:diguanylate cyclase (GGDEF)-like protein